MAVLPTDRRIDLESSARSRAGRWQVAEEEEFKPLFPDCAIGTMPPSVIYMASRPIWIRASPKPVSWCLRRALTAMRSK